jgi:hypothetical protein
VTAPTAADYERALHRVGPDCETWPNSLTENPYSSPSVGPHSGPTPAQSSCQARRWASPCRSRWRRGSGSSQPRAGLPLSVEGVHDGRAAWPRAGLPLSDHIHLSVLNNSCDRMCL